MEREAPISFWMPPVPFRSRFVSISFPVSFPFRSAKHRFYAEIAPKSNPTSSQNLLQIGPTSLQNRGLEVVWADLGAMVPSPCYFFHFLEASWGVLGVLGGVWSASWALLGASWELLEASWGRLGPNDVQMMSKLCPNYVQIVFKLYPNNVRNDIQMTSKQCPNDVQIMSK